MDADAVITKILEREAQGSTALNQGVSLPHGRIAGISEPEVALAIMPSGLLDEPASQPTQVLFLLLTPETNAASHLQVIAAVSRLLLRQDVRGRLVESRSAIDALHVLGE